MYSPFQSHIIFEFKGAHVVSSVFSYHLISGQRQISFSEVWRRTQFSVLFRCPGHRLRQREGEEPLWICRNETRGWFRQELPVNSLDTLGFDLFPGDSRKNGTGDGERRGFRDIQRM